MQDQNLGGFLIAGKGLVSSKENPTAVSFYDDLAIRAVFVKDTFKVRTVAGGRGKGSDLNQLFLSYRNCFRPSGGSLCK